MRRSLLEPALRYAALGLDVGAVHGLVDGKCTCGNGSCPHPGKHPIGGRGYLDFTTKPHILHDMFRGTPDANLAGVPASLGFVVLDADGREGCANAQQLGCAAEPTLLTITSRGVHYWFKHPGGTVGNSPIAPGVDVRGDKGYVMLSPSMHYTGVPYRSVGKFSDVKPLPPAVLALLRNGPEREPDPVPEVIEQGGRNRTLFRLGCAWRRLGASEAMILAGLEAANATACRPPLDDRELRVIAASAARYAPAAPVLVDAARTERLRKEYLAA